MGLGAILPMSALTFVLLAAPDPGRLPPGALHSRGPGGRPAGADRPRPRFRLGPGGQPDLADQGPGRRGRLLHRGRRHPVAGRRVPQPDPALRRRHRGGARRRRADLDPELTPVRLLPGQPATTCDPGPAGGPRVRPQPCARSWWGSLAYAFGWQASFLVLAAGALVFVVLAARLRTLSPAAVSRRAPRIVPNLRPNRPRCPRPPGSSPPPAPFA